MKIAILSPVLSPEMGAPQARLHELAVRLRDKGHEITVLTAMPNYPTGKVFDAYRGKFLMEEEMDGLRIIRTYIRPSKSSRSLPRLIGFLSFAISSVLLGLWRLGRQDVVMFESPPLFSVLSAIPIRYLLRCKLVMYVADVWPDIIVRMGKAKDGLFLKAMFAMEAAGYRHSDVVALTTPGARARSRSVSRKSPRPF